MKTDSELFHFLTKIQDEVHRYAIKFHRDKRSKRALHSELDEIKGIGKKSKETLLKHFKTVKKVKEADLSTLATVVGKAKADIIFRHFH
jgi:excinuclease ABC subunit C